MGNTPDDQLKAMLFGMLCECMDAARLLGKAYSAVDIPENREYLRRQVTEAREHIKAAQLIMREVIS